MSNEGLAGLALAGYVGTECRHCRHTYADVDDLLQRSPMWAPEKGSKNCLVCSDCWEAFNGMDSMRAKARELANQIVGAVKRTVSKRVEVDVTYTLDVQAIRRAFNLPETAKVCIIVPSGADWSGAELEIGQDIELYAKHKEVTIVKEEA